MLIFTFRLLRPKILLWLFLALLKTSGSLGMNLIKFPLYATVVVDLVVILMPVLPPALLSAPPALGLKMINYEIFTANIFLPLILLSDIIVFLVLLMQLVVISLLMAAVVLVLNPVPLALVLSEGLLMLAL